MEDGPLFQKGLWTFVLGVMVATATYCASNPRTLSGQYLGVVHHFERNASGLPVLAVTDSEHTGCIAPYIRDAISAQNLTLIEKQELKWFKDLRDITKEKTRAVVGWDVFNVVMQPLSVCPLERVGGSGDGGKLICAFGELRKVKNCIVYSLGSNNQWEFEEDVVRYTQCEVHTFDCTLQTVNMPSALRASNRVKFHNVCLGKESEINGHVYKPLATIMRELGHQNLTLLKMDIESYEVPVFDAMLQGEWSVLPPQICVEFHWQGQFGSVPEVSWMAERLAVVGYRTVSRDDNLLWNGGVEFTFIRTRCPELNSLEVT